MSTPGNPIELMVSVVPSFAKWYEGFRETSVGDIWPHLAHELMARAQGGIIPELPGIAPAIETALTEWDDRDQVSLGLIQTIIWEAEERQLNLLSIREALGPLGRQTWDSLQAGLLPLYLDSHHIRDFSGAPIRLDRCVPTPGRRLQADAVLARITHNNRQYELQILFPCYMDRYVRGEGSEIAEGTLVLYVGVPPDSKEARPELPYARLVEIPPNAAA